MHAGRPPVGGGGWGGVLQGRGGLSGTAGMNSKQVGAGLRKQGRGAGDTQGRAGTERRQGRGKATRGARE